MRGILDPDLHIRCRSKSGSSIQKIDNFGSILSYFVLFLIPELVLVVNCCADPDVQNFSRSEPELYGF